MRDLFLSEIFSSIQGEGRNLGKPVVFIRTWGCNNGCTFCDSRFSWDSQESADNKIVFNAENAIAGIFLTKGNVRHWVITGGEPLLQQEALIELINTFRETQGYLPTIDIETNGTIVPLPELDTLVNMYSVSPKLSNAFSGSKSSTYSHRIKEEAMSYFSNNKKAEFKFVVGSEADVSEILELQKRFSIPKDKISLMPLGKTQKELEMRSAWIFNYCVANHFSFSPRLQVILFGQRRKV